jgi:metal-responsive CopG/Arc/MetJ family transcriptional regulator
MAPQMQLNTTVQAVISVKLLKFIDSLAKKENVSRSAMIKKLLIEEYENRRNVGK